MPDMPPSMARSAPVIYRDASDARKRIAAAISPGSAGRFIGMTFDHCSNSASDMPSESKIGVFATPGEILLTRMPKSMNSAAKHFANDTTAAFDAQYAEKFFVP